MQVLSIKKLNLLTIPEKNSTSELPQKNHGNLKISILKLRNNLNAGYYPAFKPGNRQGFLVILFECNSGKTDIKMLDLVG